MRWWLARVRLKLHCFLELHEPHYFYWHEVLSAHMAPNKRVTLWRMECKFCGKLFYQDEAMARSIKSNEELTKLRASINEFPVTTDKA